MTDVEWRPIPGYPGYSVSDTGLIRSERPPNRGQLRAQFRHRGYPFVQTWDHQRHKHLYIHHAVLLAFVGPRPSPAHESRHLNGNRQDNRAINLAWGTRAENTEDRRRHGNVLSGERATSAKLTIEQVTEIRVRYSEESITQRELAAEYGVHHMAIGRIVRGETYKTAEHAVALDTAFSALAPAPAEEDRDGR